jgi:2-hydroxy-3-keto-5-methylthiopentenyl-1-phosphate phosphatase
VYIGDGTSDVKVIPYADVLFAKHGRFLAEYCAEEDIPFICFQNFAEVLEEMERIRLTLSSRGSLPQRADRSGPQG